MQFRRFNISDIRQLDTCKLDIWNQVCLTLSNLLSNLDSSTYRQTIVQFRQFKISYVGQLDICKLDICNQVCLTLSNLLSNLDSYIFNNSNI